jgi:HEAT repeat protein
MKPRSPFVPTPAPKAAGAALLALAIAAAAAAQDRGVSPVPPPAVRAQPDKKDPDKKDTPKPPAPKWPTEIGGKDVAAVLKDLEDPDPSVRELAARTLPQFGPPTHKDPKVGRLLIKRMKSEFEKDPGVRAAVFAAAGLIQFDNDADQKEAVRLLSLVVDGSPPGSGVRLAAVQALFLFGHKGGEHAIANLTGVALSDPSYETRRNIAATLGRIGFNDLGGPNLNALTKLADVLAKDPSAAVRMEALKSLLALGPPWAGVKKTAADPLPPIDLKVAGNIARFLKARVGDPAAKPPVHGLEKDRNVEVWARLVLMQFDSDEANEENLNELAHFLSGSDVGVKAQALQALALLGEAAGKKVKDVVRVLEDKDAPVPLTLASVNALGAMGAGAKPALPSLKKLLDEKKKPLEVKIQEIKKLEAAQKPLDPQLVGEAMALDGLVKTLEAAIDHIDKAKPGAAIDSPKKP